MNLRLKELRKALHLTQKDFAEKIGSKQNTIATYEIGRNNPSEPIIRSICITFNVNETCLKTGEGEMFNPVSKDEETAACIGRILSDTDEPLKALFLNAAAKLIDDDACYNTIKSMLLNILEESKRTE